MKPSEADNKKDQLEEGSLDSNASLGDDNSNPSDGGSLEGDVSSSSETDQSDSTIAPTPTNDDKSKKTETTADSKKPKKSGLMNSIKSTVKRFDIYFLAFILITIIAFVIAGIVLSRNNSAKTPSTATQNLSDSALSQLNNNDTQVGGTQQTLNIASNTVFAGNVLIKNDLDVAGTLKITNALNLPGITVSGTTTLDQVSANSLTLSGAETVNGALTVKQGLTVAGTGSFGGALSAPSISVSSLNVNGLIQIAHHLTTTGSILRSSGVTLGSGGTSTVNGNDTAGTINVNTGSGISGNNCLTSISYAQSYASTPHVIVTPVGSSAGSSQFYIANSSASGFTICADNTPSSASFSFNYFVVD